MFKSKLFMLIAILGAMALVAGACAQTSPTQADTGTLKVYITDAPPGQEITSILITVSEVQVHKAAANQKQEQNQSGNGNQSQGQEQTQQDGGEWITINIEDGDEIFDLLEIEGIEQYLGEMELEAGKYTQVRLLVDTAQVEFGNSGNLEDARIPSNELKIVRSFDIIDGETTVLVIDFDADKMVNVTGSGDIIVHPVVKLTVRQGNASNQEANLEDTRWLLQSYGEPGNLTDTLAGTEISAEFVSSEGTVKGSAGCNSYSGGYEVDGGQLSIPGPIAVTEMYCMEPEGVMEQEQQYLSILGAAETYQIENGQLQINCGDQVLIFKVDAPAIQNAVDARDAAIAYMIAAGTDAPDPDAEWQAKDTTPPGQVGRAKMQYKTGEWVIDAAYNVVLPDLTEYDIVISNDDLGVHWEGTVKADGTVTETQ